MSKQKRMIRDLFILCLCIFLCTQSVSSVKALESTTLFNGSQGAEVLELQQALIDLGYLDGKADGLFGNKTENAVRKFQRINKLSVDGLAGKKTRKLILDKVKEKKVELTPLASAKTISSSVQASLSSGTHETFSLFGTYAAIRFGNKGDRVKALQQTLITLGYLSGNADGIFGSKTQNAVKAFQEKNKLAVDGVAGKKTLKAIQSALSPGSSSGSQTSSSASAATISDSSSTPVPTSEKDDGVLNPKMKAPSSVSLLHWFNDVKPSISGGQHLLVYEPASGLSWTLRVLSRGRHCDAEPLTAQDTRTMVAAFGGVNTWNQRAVYVKLPDGRWSVASTHDMPHDSGTIKSNNFNGHLCVHFLRDMEEAKMNDPKYGVSNQETIRAKWKQMTGEEVP